MCSGEWGGVRDRAARARPRCVPTGSPSPRSTSRARRMSTSRSRPTSRTRRPSRRRWRAPRPSSVRWARRHGGGLLRAAADRRDRRRRVAADARRPARRHGQPRAERVRADAGAGAGAICTIGSELALCGDADAPHYAAAKGAIHAFTKSLAVEAAPHGVRVNCVAPGPTDTPLMTPEMRDPAYVASLVLGGWSPRRRSPRRSCSSRAATTTSSARSSPPTPERSYEHRARHRRRAGHGRGDRRAARGRRAHGRGQRLVAANAEATAERIGGQAYPFDVADPEAAAAAVGDRSARRSTSSSPTTRT